MNRYKPAHLKEKRPWEFSKKLAAWAVVISTLSTAASYILAALGRETAGDVTTTVFTACVGYLITYAAKSTTEKISRNRHRLDEDGMPIETERKDEYAETGQDPNRKWRDGPREADSGQRQS